MNSLGLMPTLPAWLDELADKVYRPLEEIPFQWDELLFQIVPQKAGA